MFYYIQRQTTYTNHFHEKKIVFKRTKQQKGLSYIYAETKEQKLQQYSHT